MQYTEHYRIVTRRNGVETFMELDGSEYDEAEALAIWNIAQNTMAAGSVVTLVRLGTWTIASASKA